MLTRKPGSDHGHYEGNISSILYSPDQGREHMNDDQFANESSGSRTSYSVSSTGDTFRSSDQPTRTYNDPSTQVRISSLGLFPYKIHLNSPKCYSYCFFNLMAFLF